jgi:hypothetical protein
MSKEQTDIYSIYKNIPTNFSSLYGGDLFTAIIILFIFIFFILYYYIINQIPQIRADWQNKRCNPIYMPFADYVIIDNTKTKFEIISNNFGQCVSDVLHSIAEETLAPLYYSTNLASANISTLYESQVELGPDINNLATNISNIGERIISKTAEVMTPQVEQSLLMKDILSQLTGIMSIGQYVAMTQYILIKKTFLALPVLFGILLGILCAALLSCWAWFPFSIGLIIVLLVLIPIVAYIVSILVQITTHLK